MFHTFQRDRCLKYSRIKDRQGIQNEGENTSEIVRSGCCQPTQMGVTSYYCAMCWDISAAVISLPGRCFGGLLREPQHICAQQWFHSPVINPPVHLTQQYPSYRGKYLATNKFFGLKKRYCMVPGQKQILKAPKRIAYSFKNRSSRKKKSNKRTNVVQKEKTLIYMDVQEESIFCLFLIASLKVSNTLAFLTVEIHKLKRTRCPWSCLIHRNIFLNKFNKNKSLNSCIQYFWVSFCNLNLILDLLYNWKGKLYRKL